MAAAGPDNPFAADAELLDKFTSYEAYLSSFITEADLKYLQDADTARRVVELGHLHGGGEVLQRADFAARKAALAAHRAALANPQPKRLLSAGRDLSAFPLLRALAERELPLRRGSLATVVFLRDRNDRGQEVSGYIDLAHRLAADEAGMAAVFAGQQRLLPQPADLSCLNWATNRLHSHASPNFEVVTDPAVGLAFKNRRDGKVIIVKPAAPSPGNYTTRTDVQTEEYEQAVIFDHVIGRCT